MTISGATVDLEIIQDTIRWARANTGIAKDHVDDAAILASLLQRAVEAAADAEQLPLSHERYRVLVIEACDRCGRTCGAHAEVPDTIVREARCDCEVVDLREGETHGHTTHNIPPATRQAVLSRDQGLCRVPGCTNRAHTVLHHVVFRSDGGGHDVYNLIGLCSAHHRMLHAGYLGIEHEDGGYLFRFPTGREVWVPHDPRNGGAIERRGGGRERPAREPAGSAGSAGSAGADRATGQGRSSGAATSGRSARSPASRSKRRSANRVASDSGSG
jgi:5-methylcytosine-specific restriction endonuclease McrA